ncbi:hypothetical protein [Bacillus sp. 1P02SD]|uniref:hypothetical protein n=1 Tax=Bacillus sp. 1P02SD TaxID=3132264 RepID=UPI00399EF438
MKLVYRIDNSGYWLGDVIVNDSTVVPPDCIRDKPPHGLFKPRYVNGQWTEGATKEEVELIIKNSPKEPTPLERLAKDQADLMLTLVMKGVI